MSRGVLAVALLEWRIALRNRWLATAVILMTVFALLLALLGSAPAGVVGVDRLTSTVSSLATLSVYLVPLIALLLSFDAFAGEAERGTLPLLLTYPVPRPAIILGKFAAHLLVLTASVAIGFGIVTGVLAAMGDVTADSLILMLRLIASAALLGGVFIAAGYCLSTIVRQTSTAASLAVALWIVAVVMLDIALLGALVADDGGVFTRVVFPWVVTASPTDAFRLFNLSALDTLTIEAGVAGAAPALGISAVTAIVALIAWPVALLALATAVFRRSEP